MSNYLAMDDVALVVRSTGERTVDCAMKLLGDSNPDASVVVINEAPFENALHSMCRVGVESGRRWTLSLDADLLVSPVRVRNFLRSREHYADNVFQSQPYVLDKIFGCVRLAGIRLYRNSALAEAATLIPRSGEKIRPEFSMIEQMKARGFGVVVESQVVGLHDYEQYYRDLFRKSYIHARKHADLIGKLLPRWLELREVDVDFNFVLQGVFHGITSSSPIGIDARMLDSEIESAFERERVPEKVRADIERVSAVYVEALLQGSDVVNEFERRSRGESLTRWGQVCEVGNDVGWGRLVPWAFGWGMQQVGLAIKNAVHKGQVSE